MDLQFWASTDVGRVRDHNEDNFLVDKRLKLFVVCDGMGGHAAGEVASAISVRAVRDVISEHRDVFEQLEADPENVQFRKAVLNLIEGSIVEANSRVWNSSQEDASRRGMGTTCSLLLLTDGRGFIGHVGDSRIYLHRQEQVHQITEDHSLINEMLRLGKIKPGEEDKVPHKNAVTRAVGVNQFVEVDTFEFDVYGGDSFLLCSDGLSGYFDDHPKGNAPLADLMMIEDVKKITEESIDFANAGGGKDNITVISIKVRGNETQVKDAQRTIEMMRVSSYFQYLSYKEMVQMMSLSESREFAAGETIVAQGADSDGLFLILEGRVALTNEGSEFTELGPGGHFCETGLIDGQPQQYAVTAVEDCEVVQVRREPFMVVLREDPNLAVKLLWNYVQTMTHRVRGLPVELLFEMNTYPNEPTPHNLADRAPTQLSMEPIPSAVDDVSEEYDPTDEVVPELDEEDTRTTTEDAAVAEDMRSTIKMDGDAFEFPTPSEVEADVAEEDEETQTYDALERKSEAESTPPIGGAISGESATKDNAAPQAHILKRSKLVVGHDEEDGGDPEDGATEEVMSLKERLKRRREAAGENVEEAN